MKILHIIKGTPTGHDQVIIDEQANNHEVTVVDIKKDKDYGKLAELIFSSDRVVAW